MIQLAMGDMTIPPALVPTNAPLIAVPLRDANQFEMMSEQGMIDAHINPQPMTVKTRYSCQRCAIRLPTSRPRPIMSVPAIITGLAPMRSMRMPEIGAETAVPTDPISNAMAKAPLPQFMSSVIGLRKIGKVLRTIPQTKNKTTKHAATTTYP
jgi:hypothetical protein